MWKLRQIVKNNISENIQITLNKNADFVFIFLKYNGAKRKFLIYERNKFFF